MGYTTYFTGEVEVSPPLNEAERKYLTKFAETRRMNRKSGPYFVEGTGFMGQSYDEDVIDNNYPPKGQPGLWCQWVPTEDGTAIVWDEGEKFYESPEWMAYIIDHFLKPGAHAKFASDPQFNEFTFDHVVNGTIYAEGEDSDDRWKLVVENNEVHVVEGRIVYADETA